MIHPNWCSRLSCTAAADPEVFEPYHRSEPILVADGVNEALIHVYLEQAPVEMYPDSRPDVVILILAVPVVGPFYLAEPVLDRLTIEAPVAEALTLALQAVTGAAR